MFYSRGWRYGQSKSRWLSRVARIYPWAAGVVFLVLRISEPFVYYLFGSISHENGS